MSEGTLALSDPSVAKTASQGRWKPFVSMISLSINIEGLVATISAVPVTAGLFPSDAIRPKLAEFFCQ